MKYLWHDQTQKYEFGCFYTMSVPRTILRKKNMGQSLFRKHSKFLIFNKAFYSDMAEGGHK